jgi:hypothetical protein
MPFCDCVALGGFDCLSVITACSCNTHEATIGVHIHTTSGLSVFGDISVSDMAIYFFNVFPFRSLSALESRNIAVNYGKCFWHGSYVAYRLTRLYPDQGLAKSRAVWRPWYWPRRAALVSRNEPLNRASLELTRTGVKFSLMNVVVVGGNSSTFGFGIQKTRCRETFSALLSLFSW